tara:strand:+ start:504 stop:953 length:450 start_codon:yes stop_codon:yes gene_type:complete
MAVQYALIADNGEVQHVVSSGADSDYVTGQIYHGLLAVQVTSDTDGHQLINTKYYIDGTWHSREPRSSPWQDWVDNAWVINSERIMVEVRRDRTQRLYECDWTQLSDATITDEKKAQWAAYRQLLRNFPTALSGISNIDEVQWPNRPSE